MATVSHARNRATVTAPLIKLASPDVGEEEVEAVTAAMRSGILTNGPNTVAFEAAMARLHGVDHAVAFSNGTVALAGIYLALGIGPGDEVIVPSMTFISTATSVMHVGAKPVFAEVQEDTFNLDPEDAAARITPRTRAIVAVHYGGQPADLAELKAVATAAGVDLIEDAAQAHGASYRDDPIGGHGRAAMFSFTPTKNITTGEGGMVTTNDKDLAARLRLLRNHGQTRLYEHDLVGYNWRMTEMQAAMGVCQVDKLSTILNRKWANDDYLRSRFPALPGVQLPVVREDRTHPFMLYTLKLPAGIRDQVLNSLLKSRIEARVYFPPAHLQRAFKELPPTALPRTERIAAQILSIPFHSKLGRTDLDRITDSLAESVRTAGAQ